LAGRERPQPQRAPVESELNDALGAERVEIAEGVGHLHLARRRVGDEAYR
jgi:hypothetical protein